MNQSQPPRPIRLYRHPLSGHAHRVQLMLSLLDLPHELVEVDLRAGEHKTPAYLAKNAFGQVPVIEDGDVHLADSNAILVYLALRYDPGQCWLPRAPEAAARVQRWLSVAAGQLVAGPAAARRAAVFGGTVDEQSARAIAAQLFTVLDQELALRPFLVGSQPTLADVALYTYTAHAPEGGISLEPYAHLRRWLQRVEALPGFVGMQRTSPSVAP